MRRTNYFNWQFFAVVDVFFWLEIDGLEIEISHWVGLFLIQFRVLTVHGSADEVIPVEDALEFAKIIPNHKLQIVEGANHSYTSHQTELASIVLDFIKTALQQD